MRRSLASAGLTAAAALALTGCTPMQTVSTESGEVQLVSEGSMTMCANSPYKPFEFDRGGEIVGLDPDLGTEIARSMGVELTVLNTSFESLESGSALSSLQCDVVISGMGATEERESVMDLSQPYVDDSLAVLTLDDSGIASAEDLPGRRVGVQQGTSGDDYADEAGLEKIQYEDTGLLLQALATGQLDAVVGNLSIFADELQTNERATVVDEIGSGEPLVVGVRQGNENLLRHVDSVLAEMERDGRLDAIRSQWLGAEAADAARPEAPEAS
ncbi:ABC transporter substrate-binding protein [Rothia sp. AR01]|uniref:ABC transporter substrate-binding protein n=1 Tax=Rothia santali TaxID=2949643 RepID=A0A9X2KJG9_9MICC|nr:ABC transporter substrate-binding protein [Rothia santali]MCP3427075.1 ABC transporter substrate-binding protein [Rothia santali]